MSEELAQIQRLVLERDTHERAIKELDERIRSLLGISTLRECRKPSKHTFNNEEFKRACLR